jgi:myo-inositol 2-dehydrogenase/D-chiro-inositol 1-dehydrogenase
LASIQDEATFRAVVDPGPANARATADRLKAPWSFGSWADLISNRPDEFDGVVIRTVCDDGAAVAISAADAGKHVLLESPLLVAESDTAEAVAAHCIRANVWLMVGQPLRFMYSQLAVKNALDSGKLGDLGLLRIHHWRPQSVNHRELEGENRLGSSPVHRRVLNEVDLADWLFGGLPTEVYCVRQRCESGEPDAHRYLQVHLGFPGGGMALIDCASDLPSGAGYFSLSVIGSAGAAYADDHHNMNLLYRGGNPTALNAGQSDDPFVAQVNEFVSAIQLRRPPSATVQDARNARRVVDAAVESLKTGQVITLVEGQCEVAES